MTNVIGCHGAVWAGSIDDKGFRAMVEGTKEAGFDMLELPLLDPYGFDAKAARVILDESGLGINASLALGYDTDISSERPEAIAAGEALLERAIEVLHDLGGHYLIGVTYGALMKHAGPASEQGRRNGIEVLRRIAEKARAADMVLGLEVVNRYESNLFNTAKEALAYLDEIDNDNVKIHLDTYHMNIEESDMFGPVLASADKLGYIHIGESHRGYLGSGSVDFDSFFRALAIAGYTGPITFESFSSVVVDPGFSNMLAIWRNLWDDADDLGREANSFIRNKLRAVETITLQ
jgi:D-psicose/D-tagatose/L-ribulose 3-epimerase